MSDHVGLCSTRILFSSVQSLSLVRLFATPQTVKNPVRSVQPGPLPQPSPAPLIYCLGSFFVHPCTLLLGCKFPLALPMLYLELNSVCLSYCKIPLQWPLYLPDCSWVKSALPFLTNISEFLFSLTVLKVKFSGCIYTLIIIYNYYLRSFPLS